MVSVIVFVNAATAVLRSAGVMAEVSMLSKTLSPTLICAVAPAGAASFRYATDAWARNAFATSQDFVNCAVPTGLNWNEHAAGSAMTTTGADRCAAASAGFAYSVNILNSGK